VIREGRRKNKTARLNAYDRIDFHPLVFGRQGVDGLAQAIR
jgi:hypothetical protein